MTSRAAQSYIRPFAAAITEGASTPNPGTAGVVALSTTTGTLMRWTGSVWTAAANGMVIAGTNTTVTGNGSYATPWSVNAVSGYSDDTVTVVPTGGTAQTLPAPTSSAVTVITLTSASCALTFPAAVAGRSFSLILVQDATGSRVVTWPVTVKWPQAIPPALTTVATKADVFTFMCWDAANWLAFNAGRNY